MSLSYLLISLLDNAADFALYTKKMLHSTWSQHILSHTAMFNRSSSYARISLHSIECQNSLTVGQSHNSCLRWLYSSDDLYSKQKNCFNLIQFRLQDCNASYSWSASNKVDIQPNGWWNWILSHDTLRWIAWRYEKNRIPMSFVPMTDTDKLEINLEVSSLFTQK